MFFLAGLLGMMALGSVVMVSTSSDDDDVPEDDIQPETEDAFDGHGDASTSLFEQMGLPNGSTDTVFNDDATDLEDDAGAIGGTTQDASFDRGDENVAQFTDFNGAEDQLMVVYDDSTGDESPELEMRQSADDENTTEIVVGGVVLATIPTEDAPVLDAVVLVGESTASELEMA